MNDYDFITNEKYYDLHLKYKYLFIKFWAMMLKQVKSYYYDEDFEDFFIQCYSDVTFPAAKAIKLEKIKDPATWTFYIQLYHYLQNYTVRVLTKNFLKRLEHEQQISIENMSNNIFSYVPKDYNTIDLMNSMDSKQKIAYEILKTSKTFNEYVTRIRKKGIKGKEAKAIFEYIKDLITK